MGDEQRFRAWNRELLAVHDRLRQALTVARDAVATDDPATARREIQLYCHGFCVALSGHHVAEDVTLFPELSERHPELRATIAQLEQDHAMIGTLLAQFDQAIAGDATPGQLSLHLEGLAAIMESHFAFEERKLLDVLETLDLEAEPTGVLGPF